MGLETAGWRGSKRRDGGTGDRSYDVAIVGAGVVGAAIAWTLSLYDVRVLWLEAAYDVGEGASKANAGFAVSGFDTASGTLETDLIRYSSPLWEDICERLDVPFWRCGSLLLAFSSEDRNGLGRLAEQAAANGVESELLSRDEALTLAPIVSHEISAALCVREEAVLDPMRLTLGYAEAAVANGVELRLGSPLTGIERDSGGHIRALETPTQTFQARFLVNAAGVHADEIARLADAEPFSIWPRKGEFFVLDRDVGDQVPMIIGQAPRERTRGVIVAPTTNRTALIGATAEDVDDKVDKSTSEAGREFVTRGAQRLVPAVTSRSVIKGFAGLRPASESPYRVERSVRVPNLIHAAAIRSTGISSSPGVAWRVRCLLEEAGLALKARPNPIERLRRLPRLAETPTDLIPEIVSSDERYGTVVCACEHVSAAEVLHALKAPIPATSIDGVRKRTRATGGRCQGAYCMAGVASLLSMSQGVPPEQIPVGDPSATLLTNEA
jgi:glycerol-3-phosphate dehydrogenase